MCQSCTVLEIILCVGMVAWWLLEVSFFNVFKSKATIYSIICF